MIESVIEYCAKNRFIVFLLVGAAAVLGFMALRSVPLDALPDLSDTQVIIYSRFDRSPDIVEDQVTYPIVSAMLGTPRVKSIRGFSDFGYSYVYVIFEDGTDIYWARSRTLEYLNKILPQLPEGVKTEIGPDATGVGWVFMYALVDRTGKQSLADLRSYQDWYLKFKLQSVPGVAEVASLGGFVRQYQVNIDPNALLAYNIPLMKVVDAIRRSNNDVGGRLVEFSGAEYMVRGRGYIKDLSDLEKIAVGDDGHGNPVTVKEIASVAFGPDIRRGIADLDGEGEVTGGIVVMRHGENALKVIDEVKKKLDELKPSLPPGVEVITTYDRSDLIHESISTVRDTLVQELMIVAAMIILFLWSWRSALIPVIVLPIAILIAFIPMLGLKLTSNVMSLGGIVIAIGDMVDGSIAMVENIHTRLDQLEKGIRRGTRESVMLEAMKEIGPPLFSSLLVLAISFMPIFTLEAQEGRLFKPLAFTKNFSLFFAAILTITLVPALSMLLIKGKLLSEEKHPVSKFLIGIYRPVVEWAIKKRRLIALGAAVIVLLTIPVFLQLGSEFMPPLEEGSIFYMPTTLPGLSVTEAQKLLAAQDKILKSFPEVERVFGKAGRAETSTDPAPFSMMETTITLKAKKHWRPGMTFEKLLDEMDHRMQFPGVSNAWTMPIKARIDMLTTGVRTPVGIKIFGPDLKTIEGLGGHLEMILKEVPGARNVYAERVSGGYFLDFDLKRNALARYGLTVDDANMVIMSAIGGENITTVIKGRERYPVNLRYARDFRGDIDRLKRVLVPVMSGAQIPLSQIADISLRLGPGMIRDENGMLSGYVYVDMAGRDLGGFVKDAKAAVKKELKLPQGYSIVWSGQYEFLERLRGRLFVFVPLTLFIIFILYYFTFKSVTQTLLIMLSVPFALVGGIWYLFLLHYNLSIAVWVGLIALAGISAETGSIMFVYLNEAYNRRKEEGRMKTKEDLYAAVMEGAVLRLRPKLMTVIANIFGLLPVMVAAGTGADTMRRIAAPIVGGLTTSMLLTLIVLPAIYTLWKERELSNL